MKKRSFSFYYEVTKGISVRIISNTQLVGELIRIFLFPRMTTKPKGKTVSLTILENQKKKQFGIRTSTGKTLWHANPVWLLSAIDHEVRWLVATHLPSDFFPIHSAGFIKGGRASLLLGDSGAGKSRALMELAKKGHPCLSDELNFLDFKHFRIYPYYRHWNIKDRLPKHLPYIGYTWMRGRRPGAKRKETTYYVPTTASQNIASRGGKCLHSIYILKSRRARKMKSRKLSLIEIIKHLADNTYVAPFRGSRKTPYTKRYDALFLRLFKQIAGRQGQLVGAELQVPTGKSFTQLI